MHFILFLYLMALPRFFQTLAGLDTGSAFGGLGSSREVAVSAMAEPALILSFCGLAYLGGADTVSGMVAGIPPGRVLWRPEVILLAGTMFLLLLAENARIPVDDPATHLELTMIHEAMVLDHAGVDLAMIQLASGVRLVLFSALVSGTLFPEALSLPAFLAIPAAVVKVVLSGALIGAAEAGMARMKLSRVASYLLIATVLAAIALSVRYAGEGAVNTVTILLLLLGLHIAVTERIRPAIHSLAAQGILLGLLPFLAAPVPAWRAAGLGLATVAVKSVAIPLILTRAMTGWRSGRSPSRSSRRRPSSC